MSPTEQQRNAAATALEQADAELAIAKAALAKNPSDTNALDKREAAQRLRDRAAYVLEAATTQCAEATAAAIAEARALAKAERDANADAASLSRVLVLIAPDVDALVALEARATELVKSIGDVVNAGNQRMRLAYPGHELPAPLSLDVAKDLVREKIKRARETLHRLHDPNCGPWLDSAKSYTPKTSAEIQAQFVAKQILRRIPERRDEPEPKGAA
jgi:multidrug efflux pump subunit AcrA (membrane-fusion protein)